MKETIFKCDECRGVIDSKGLSVDFQKSANSIITILVYEKITDEAEQHFCNYAHLIEFVSKGKMKGKEVTT